MPLVRLLIRLGVTPNVITTIGLIINVLAAVVFVFGAERANRGEFAFIGWASALILFAGLFDILDGQVAREGKMKTTFGAIYDSVLDRYSELVMFLGICYYLVAHGYFLSSLFAFIAMIGSVMVSYTRARAEGAGIQCNTGLMQRPARIIIIGVSGIICAIAAEIIGSDYKLILPFFPRRIAETISIFVIPIAVVAVLSNITAIGRLRHCRKQLL
ncbi:MAG: CDP-alcohol phosphatidyltransferase family protein [Bacteroidetes bacterium]|nr:CDP-alcohol phosphatidyltransferase family protein [Bacteroidota bacterium]